MFCRHNNGSCLLMKKKIKHVLQMESLNICARKNVHYSKWKKLRNILSTVIMKTCLLMSATEPFKNYHSSFPPVTQSITKINILPHTHSTHRASFNLSILFSNTRKGARLAWSAMAMFIHCPQLLLLWPAIQKSARLHFFA